MNTTNLTPETDFLAGTTLLINKPLHMTSYEAVSTIKYLLKRYLGLKKIKVGHAGTLDPLATGLLIVCTGKHTKLISQYQDLPKTYTGTFTLGATTPSFDLETPITETFDITPITKEMIKKTAQAMLGEQMQTPPIFSAKKIDGERAYEKARRGENIDMQKNKITIYQFDILDIRLHEVDFSITCSKGTYIRSIANDFGKLLNNGAYLSKLCRTKIGNFTLKEAINIEDFKVILASVHK